MVGPFANDLALRTLLSGDPIPGFRTLVARVRETVLGAYGHQELPFQLHAAEAGNEADRHRRQILHAAFSYANPPDHRSSETYGLTRPVPIDTRLTRYDLSLQLEEQEDGAVSGSFIFCPDLFRTATVTRMAAHWLRLVEAVCNDLDIPHVRLPLLSEPERRRLIWDWNNTRTATPQASLWSRIAKRAARFPRAPAVIFGDELDIVAVDCAGLDRRSRQIALGLRRLGLLPETLVGVQFNESPDFAVVTLGILRAGGAVLPLDPDLSDEWFARILTETRTKLVFSADGAKSHDDIQFLAPDQFSSEPLSPTLLEREEELEPKGLAAVIFYRAGTRFRNAMVTHGSLLNRCAWSLDVYNIQAGDHTALVTDPVGFFWEFWPFITIGAPIFTPTASARTAPERLLAWLEAHQIRLCICSAKTAGPLLAEIDSNGSSLQALITRGEPAALSPSSETKIRVTSHYGPIESAAASAWSPIRKNDAPTRDKDRIPIGRPSDNTRIYLLDRFMEPVAVGAHGEIFIAGHGLGRGYYEKPDLTANRFIPDPFSSAPGGRLFRSRDLGAYRPSGEIVWFGNIGRFTRERTITGRLSFWRKELAGAPFRLDLPIDFPRPTEPRTDQLTVRSDAPLPVGERVHQFCAERKIPVICAYAGAFSVLLARYTHVLDPLIGISTRDEDRAGDDRIGTLIFRNPLNANPNFAALINQVRETFTRISAQRGLSFDILAETLQPNPEPGASPIVQAGFAYEGPDGSGLTSPCVACEASGRPYDLTLTVRASETGAELCFAYNPDLFRTETVKRASDHYVNLLRILTANPRHPVLTQSYLTREERHLILDIWNEERTIPLQEESVHEKVESWARRTPDNLAMILPELAATPEFSGSDGVRRSYQELNRAANRLARFLESRGAGPGSLIGLCFDRSPEMATAALAVLKTGGAYAPMDPANPVKRMVFLREDAGLSLILTRTEFLDRFEPETPALIDLATLALETYRDDEHAVPTGPDYPAYVLYSSDATGRPKGVLIRHREIVRLFRASNAWSRFGPEDVWTFTHPPFLNGSVWEMWGALAMGGRLVIVPDSISRSANDFLRLLADEKVTVLNLAPSAFNRLITAVEREIKPELASLRLVMLAGESFDLQELRPWFDRYGHEKPRIVRMYGFSETTVHATYRSIQASDLANPVTGAIGRPIHDLQIYLLDRHSLLTPCGVTGEIYIGGEGLAMGYLNRPVQTAERFTPHPFSTRPGARLFKSGDLARSLADGSLVFLTRIAPQIQIHGFLIESGEIESVLRRHPVIRNSTVMVRSILGEPRLVAYLTTERAARTKRPSASELRGFVTERLPAYMSPTYYVYVTDIPLSAQGKPDRAALPNPAPGGPDAIEPYREPRTATEETLVAIWESVVGVAPIGIGDDFLALGGQSLMAINILFKVRRLLGFSLSFENLFRYRTIERLAYLIQPAFPDESVSEPRPTWPSADPGRPIPLTSAKLQQWRLHQADPGNPDANLAAAFELRGPLDRDLLQKCLNLIVTRHESLRTAFVAREGVPVQILRSEAAVTIGHEDLREATRAESLDRAARECERPFELDVPPLIRCRLYQREDSCSLLALAMHPIIGDDWSIGVFLDELSARYDGFRQGPQPDAQPLSNQYADYTLWQNTNSEGSSRAGHLDYWRRRLAGAPILDLPTDEPYPFRLRRPAANHLIPFPPSLAKPLRALALSEGTTLFAVVLAGLHAFLSRYSGQTEVLIGTPAVNRTRPAFEKLIGRFANTLVIRADLAGSPTFRALIAQIRDRVFEAVAHQELPFEVLAEEFDPNNRGPHGDGLVRVSFALADHGRDRMSFGGLRLTRENINRKTTDRDLTLILDEDPNQGARFRWIYDADLFYADAVSEMAQRFQTLLKAVTAEPDLPIEDRELTTTEERRRLILAWSRSRQEEMRAGSLHAVFASWSVRQPNAPALVTEHETITYDELQRRSYGLAKVLRRTGAGPGTLVGVTTRQTPETIIALLAILKTGAAYLPLDPTDSSERLGLILTETRPAALLIHAKDRATMPLDGQNLIELDRATGVVADDAGDIVLPETGPGDRAYVLYLTGQELKAVDIAHQGILRLVIEPNYAAYRARDVFFHYTPLSFDASNLEIWGPLLNGASLAIFPDGPARTEELGAFIERFGVTVLAAPPGLFHGMVEAGVNLEKVQHLVLTGETVSGNLIREIRARFPDLLLIHVHGPAENTLFTLFQNLGQADPNQATLASGGAVSGSNCIILDRSLRLTPTGAFGELYTAGSGLARGYFARPDLTARSFIPNPFGQVIGDRLYRTGEMARYLASGKIAPMNRAELNGRLVEPDRINAKLGEHPLVRESLVLVRENTGHQPQLVAYIRMGPEQAEAVGGASPEESLQNYLAERLPDYMVPSIYISLERFPLTAHGKIDQNALPGPVLGEAQPEAPPPETGKRDEVQHLFTEQCWRNRDRIAVVATEPEGTRYLSFAALNRRADMIAGHLTRHGVGPEQAVGLYARGGTDFMTGLFATLKAGAAYVPIPSEDPPARVGAILTAARASMILTERALVEYLPQTPSPVLLLESIADDGESKSVAADPGHPACILFNDKASNQSVGAVITRQTLLDRVRRRDWGNYLSQDSAGEPVSMCFNAAVTRDTDPYQALQILNGHTLHLAAEETMSEPNALADYLVDRQIEILAETPDRLRSLVDSGLFERPNLGLKSVILRNEAIDITLWAELSEHPNIRFFSVYGPSVCLDIAAGVWAPSCMPNIGRPYDDARVYLLDTALEPASYGATGRIYVSTPDLARGYYGRPDLTAVNFIPNPFRTEDAPENPENQSRLFRTGELALWDPDGNLRLLERKSQEKEWDAVPEKTIVEMDPPAELQETNFVLVADERSVEIEPGPPPEPAPPREERQRFSGEPYHPGEAAPPIRLAKATLPEPVAERGPGGKPFAISSVFVLSKSFMPMPLGFPGQLCVGGAGLVRGYLNRPDLTALKFAPDPFSRKPGARLFLTGDLARISGRPEAGSAIEILGRIDQQSEIRGSRVGFDKIEAVLTRHLMVDAVAVILEEQDGESRLTAYIGSAAASDSNAEELNLDLMDHLKSHLPESTMPNRLEIMHALPLTPEGKIDRVALSAAGKSADSASENRPPDDIERRLIDLWTELLHVPVIGPDDDFFELGGHSYLSLKLIKDVERRFGRKPNLADFYRDPTVANLAKLISSSEKAPLLEA